MDNIKFSLNAQRLIINANNMAKEYNHNVIHPIHLFFSALEGDKEANKELKSYVSKDFRTFVDKFKSLDFSFEKDKYVQIKIDDLNLVNISLLTRGILIEAKRISELYEEHGQIFVSEGHILRAVFECEDKLTKEYLSNINQEVVLSIIASPRDMIVDLKNDFDIHIANDVIIRRVTEKDKPLLKEFVLKNFYETWANTVDYGLELVDIPIFIALIDNNIVGFAGYNISKKRKGYFGPLGVLRLYRGKKIGQSLLNTCLMDMKKLGFKTCVIGNASTHEFYEKACGAKLIPKINT